MATLNLNDRRRDVAREICRIYGVTLSVEALHAFASILVPTKVLRGVKLVAEGEVCNCMYYLDRGMVLQTYKKNHATVTEHISHEGDMVVCIESYFLREPSRIVASTIEPSVIFAIPRDAMEAIARHSFELCQLIFKFYERALIICQGTICAHHEGKSRNHPPRPAPQCRLLPADDARDPESSPSPGDGRGHQVTARPASVPRIK